MDESKIIESTPHASSSSKKKQTSKKRRLGDSVDGEDSEDTEDYRTAADTFLTSILDCGFNTPREQPFQSRPLDGTPGCTLLLHWQPLGGNSDGISPAATQDGDSVQNFVAREAGHLRLHDLDAEVRCRSARGGASTTSGSCSEENHLVGRLSAVKTPWSCASDWTAQVPVLGSVALPNHGTKAPGFTKTPFACSSPPAKKTERRALKESGLQHCLDTCLNVGMAITAMDLQPAVAEIPSCTSSSNSSSSSSTSNSTSTTSGFWLAVGGSTLGSFGTTNPYAAEANLLGVPTAGANLIQLWFLPCSDVSEDGNSLLKPWLVYGLLHERSSVRDLKWAPLGSSAFPSNLRTGAAPDSESSRAGVLAVAAGDAAVRVYALPTHAASGASPPPFEAGAAAPVLRLAPLAVCTAPSVGVTIETVRWRPVAWGGGGGHKGSSTTCRSSTEQQQQDDDNGEDHDEYDYTYGLNCLAAGVSDGTLLVWSLPKLAHSTARSSSSSNNSQRNDNGSSSGASTSSSQVPNNGVRELKPTRVLLSLSALRPSLAQTALRAIAWSPDSAALPPGYVGNNYGEISSSGGGGLVACVDTYGMARLWDLALPRGPLLEAASLRKDSSGMGPTSSQQWVKVCEWAPRGAGLFVAGGTPNAVLMHRWRRNALRLTKHPYLHEGIVGFHATTLAPKAPNTNTATSSHETNEGDKEPTAADGRDNGVIESEKEPTAAATGIDVVLSASSDGSLFVSGLAAALYDNAPRFRHSRNRLGRTLALSGLAAVPSFETENGPRVPTATGRDERMRGEQEDEVPVTSKRVFEVSHSPMWVDTAPLPYAPPVVPKAKNGSKSSGKKTASAGKKNVGSGTAAEAAAMEAAAAEATREAAFGLCPGGGRAALTTMCCAHVPSSSLGHLAADLLVCTGSVCGLVRVQSLPAATADQFRT